VTRPLLYVQDVLPQLDPDLVAEGSIDDKIQAGIDRLLSMQTPSGGFGIWPGDRDPVLWGTAYVVHLLLDADAKGYRVPEHALKEAVDWLDHNAENPDGGPKFRGTSPGYVQYVLSRAGRPHTAIVAKMLKAEPDGTGPDAESRMLLMAAMYAAGDRRYATILRAPSCARPTPARSTASGTTTGATTATCAGAGSRSRCSTSCSAPRRPGRRSPISSPGR
jgi:uncharacterized protein YfaS (alpha-2-macroglobulin family)